MSTDQFAPLSSGIRLAYRTRGNPSDPAVLLIAGLGQDLTAWQDPFIDRLVAAGLFVVHHDNRDAGRSTLLEQLPPPGIPRMALRRPRGDGYALEDMGADAVGLLDHLGIERAHLVGQSMGGMIAQTIAAHHPSRTASLTSIYSTTGHASVGQPAISTQLRLLHGFARPAADRDTAVRQHVALTAHLGGRAYPIDRAEEAALGGRIWDRIGGNGADQRARQVQAILTSGDRTDDLRRINAPTLVVHGDRDLIVHTSGGRATADAIDGACLVVLPGMGHHLAAGLTDRLVALLTEHVLGVSRPDTRLPGG